MRTFWWFFTVTGWTVKIDQYRFVSNNLNIFPLNDDIRVLSQQAEQPVASTDDQCGNLRRTSVYLQIVHKAQPRTVTDIDNLFFVHVRYTCDHNASPLSEQPMPRMSIAEQNS